MRAFDTTGARYSLQKAIARCSGTYERMAQYPRIDIAMESARGRYSYGVLPNLSVEDQAEEPLLGCEATLRLVIAHHRSRDHRSEMIDTTLMKNGLPVEPVDSWEAFFKSSMPLGLTVAKSIAVCACQMRASRYWRATTLWRASVTSPPAEKEKAAGTGSQGLTELSK